MENFICSKMCIASEIVSKHWHVRCVVDHRRNTKIRSKDNENKQTHTTPHKEKYEKRIHLAIQKDKPDPSHKVK